jgi:hypothetical protein
VASDNIGSLRAAQKAGFKITGTRNVVRTRAEQPNPADNPPQGLAPTSGYPLACRGSRSRGLAPGDRATIGCTCGR